jgi:hypothetical protein
LSTYQAQAARGECDLGFFDESGFSLNPPLRYGWAPRGVQPALVPQCHAQRFNVIGLQRHQGALQWTGHWGAVTSREIVAFFDLLSEQLERPLRVVLDNAGIHRAKIVQARRAHWRAMGLELVYLPPYSPELNLIEILWKQLKYFWLPFIQMDHQQIEALLQSILNQHGTQLDISYA